MIVTIPRDFTPRAYQVPVLRAMDSGIRHAILVWHRRAGKDLVCLNYMVKKMAERRGIYFYLMPTFNQGRKVIWDGVDNTGRRLLDAFPDEFVRGKPNETEMQITTANGSIFQVIGTDDYNKIMGTNPVGLVYSEYMLQDPKARAFLMPILAANGGWEILNFTPRGANNHATELYESASQQPQDWFTEVLTIDDTLTESGEPVVPAAELARIRRDHEMTEEEIQQEFNCVFTGSLEGLIYGHELSRCDAEGRIRAVPYDPYLDVETWWDIGRDDATAIWCVQRSRNEVRFIDFHQKRLEGLPYFVKHLREWAVERRAVYSGHFPGWDMAVHEYATNQQRVLAAWKLGLRPAMTPAPKLGEGEGIDAVRRAFPTFYFDAASCAEGIKALRGYKRKFDAENRCFLKTALHNWASNPADALRNGVLASRAPREIPFQHQALTEFDVFTDRTEQEVA